MKFFSDPGSHKAPDGYAYLYLPRLQMTENWRTRSICSDKHNESASDAKQRRFKNLTGI